MYVEYENNYIKNNENIRFKYYSIYYCEIKYKINKIENIPNSLHILYISENNKINKIENIPNSLHALEIWGSNEVVDKIENIPNSLHNLYIDGYNKINKIENLNFNLRKLYIPKLDTSHIKLNDINYRKSEEYINLIDLRFKKI